MKSLQRIVVFTQDPPYSVFRNIVAIDRAVPGLTWLLVIRRPRRTLARTLGNQWRRLRHDGWRRVPLLAAAVRSRLQRRHGPPLADGAPGGEFTAAAVAGMDNVRVHRVHALHAPESLDTVRAFRPDLGLTLSAPIVKPALFELPRLGTLNLHKGRLPDHRGVMPAFWELWHREPEVGCTVHRVDAGLDTGPIVATTSVPCARYSTVKGLRLALDEVGIDLMRDAVVAVARGTLTATPQSPGGHTYRRPTPTEQHLLARRLARDLPHRATRPQRIMRDTVRRSMWTAASLPAWPVRTPRVTVLLYHRVTDDARDDLSVGIEQFDRQMALLRRHFQVVPLADLLRLTTVPASRYPLVSVTFDDGYLDNFLNAVPILLRNRVHATFFVATGFIGTERQFPHDVGRGYGPIPLMTWDNLRAMRNAGFAIDAHTVNHIDCAREPEATVIEELAASRDTVRRELGTGGILFSYPYGGRENMTPARLGLVKEAGFVGCVSAYGGVNVGTVERFDIRRRGIHWEYSDAGFLAAAAGLP